MLRSFSLENAVVFVIWLILRFCLIDETSVLKVVLWLILFSSFDVTSLLKVVLWLMLDFTSVDNTVVLWLILKSLLVNEASVLKVGLFEVLILSCDVSVIIIHACTCSNCHGYDYVTLLFVTICLNQLSNLLPYVLIWQKEWIL